VLQKEVHDMADADAARSGKFLLGGELAIHRLGYGAMRVTGSGIWGEPADRAECLRTLRRVPELGVNFIDTADSYGPDISELMIREALHPYRDVIIATKGGQVRPGPDEWVPVGRPAYLEQQVKMSLRHLGADRITLWQLHRIDPDVPRDEQFGAIKSMLDQGLIRFAGLSEVTVEEVKAAEKVFPVATVQNRYSATFRRYDDVLEYCESRGIGFIPWYPLSGGALVKADSPVAEVARRHQASAAQVAIAWLLKRSPVMIPIPGTSKHEHLEENVAAADIELTDAEFEALGNIAVS
jgi:aryl-alcohol dehydrogenase-like predicted oxidoreductase